MKERKKEIVCEEEKGRGSKNTPRRNCLRAYGYRLHNTINNRGPQINSKKKANVMQYKIYINLTKKYISINIE